MLLRDCKDKEKLLDILHLALGSQSRMKYRLSPQEWRDNLLIFQQHGIIAVVMHGISRYSANYLGLPSELLFEWLGKSLAVEAKLKSKYDQEKGFARKLRASNIPVVVLKGSAFAQYYPKPETRECGDLDCFLMGKKEEGDALVVAAGGKMEAGGYKHSHLYYNGLVIENHRFLTSFDNTLTGIKTERLLQKLIRVGCSPLDETSGLLKPSPLFNAFFLIKHASRHFLKEGINLRFLLDWFFFIKAEQYNVDWPKVFSMMKENHIYNFACVMTALCVERLGAQNVVEPLREASEKANARLTSMVFDDILTIRKPFFSENIFQKSLRILRRFYRMWVFRSLADEVYSRLVWNSMFYNSISNRKVKDVIVEDRIDKDGCLNEE